MSDAAHNTPVRSATVIAEPVRLPRRRFLQATGAMAAAGLLRPLAAEEPHSAWLRRSLKGGMLNVPGDWTAKLNAAKAARFEGVEPNTGRDLDVDALAKAAKETGVTVDGTVGGYHWQVRHSDPDKAVRKEAMELLMLSLQQTHDLGADTFLIVPGHGKDGTTEEVNDRAKAALEEALPTAERLGVRILIENVWNQMFYDAAGGEDQSAQALADFIDSFDSPWVGTQFDLGNHWKFGDVAEWVTTLGPRIMKLDIKGFSRETGKFTDIGEGDIDWAGVRTALADVGFTGWLAAEVGGGDETRLRKIADQMDAALHCDKSLSDVRAQGAARATG